MTAPKDHPAAASIRRALQRRGLQTSESWGPFSGRFSVADAAGREVIAVALSRADGVVRCTVTDLRPEQRGGARPHHFAYRDVLTGSLEKSDRQSIDAARRVLAEAVERYAEPDLPPAPDVDGLAERLREIIAADPDGAADRIARAVAEATDAATTEEIAAAVGDREPAYGN